MRRAPILAVLVLLTGVFLGAFPASAAPGELDPGFGVAGKVVTDCAPKNCAAAAVAVDHTGRIVVGGSVGTDLAVYRYESNGDLDQGFGSGGSGQASEASALTVGKDNRIVAAGISGHDVVLLRFKSNGDLDTHFGGGPIPGTVSTAVKGSSVAVADVELQSDGGIVVLATASFRRFVLLRFASHGALDPSFDHDGRVSFTFPNVGHDPDSGTDVSLGAGGMAIQANGKIVVAGGLTPECSASNIPDGLVLARVRPDGSLDPSFDGDGRVVTRFKGGDGRAFDVAVQPDGRIVTAGSVRFTGCGGSSPNDDSLFALTRYEKNGKLDKTFGGDGRVVGSGKGQPYDSFSAVAVQGDGKIVAGGGRCCTGGGDSDFAVARYLADGTADQSFGGTGIVTTDLGGVDFAYGLAIENDGKIVVAGATGKKIGLVRYLP
ncbi:MAG: hypothetical protein ABR600_10185 [Actinomycetota bacterium]